VQDREERVQVSRSVAKEPSTEDAAWPIVSSDSQNWIDTETGEVVEKKTVVRQLIIPAQEADPELCESLNLQVGCARSGTITILEQATRGGVTGYVKHTMETYCKAGDCSWRKPTKLEVWWTRTNPN
jgi:hypothetical protein